MIYKKKLFGEYKRQNECAKIQILVNIKAGEYNILKPQLVGGKNNGNKIKKIGLLM